MHVAHAGPCRADGPPYLVRVRVRVRVWVRVRIRVRVRVRVRVRARVRHPLRRHLPIEWLEARGYTGRAGALAHLLRVKLRLRDRMRVRLRARAEVRLMVRARVRVSARVRVRWHTGRCCSETRLACCT